MISNYLKIAWRQLLKSKTNSIIKIGGLSISIAFFLLVTLFIKNEFSYDDFHTDGDRIYRVEEEIDMDRAKARGSHVRLFSNYEEVSKSASIPPAIAPSFVEEIPEAVSYTRYLIGYTVVKKDNSLFNQVIQFVDPNFFEFFSFRLLNGKQESVLSNLSNCVLAEEFAKKYFGDTNPIGQTLNIKLDDKFKSFIVSGVAENPPDNSSIYYSVLLPIDNSSQAKANMNNFADLSTSNFVKLKKGYTLPDIRGKIDVFSRSKMAGIWGNGTFEETEDPENITTRLTLTNLEDIYLKPGIVANEESSNPVNSYLLGGIALLILLVACTNYISIALASSSNRSMEVGIRKVMGAMKSSITGQFLSEALIVSLISAALGILLAESLLPVFNDIIGAQLNETIGDNLSTISIALVIGLFVGFLAGLYPALIMSNFKSILSINRSRNAKFKTRFTSALVGFQFAVSSFLITSAVIMSNQMNYVNDVDLGYDPSNVVVLPLYGSSIDGNTIVRRFHNEFDSDSDILDITGSSKSFGRGISLALLNINGEKVWSNYQNVDDNFIPMMKINLLAGRNFDTEKYADNESTIIVNKRLAATMGIDGSQLPYTLVQEDEQFQVVGITSNFNFESLLNEVKPLFLYPAEKTNRTKYALFKISGGDPVKTIGKLRSSWASIVPDTPFEYDFMEDVLSGQYDRITHWQNVVNASMIFAVIIAVLGLFGITGLQASNRTKEIGIRKVLGANIKDVVYLINKKILSIAVVSFIIAIPVSVYASQKWLDNFAYKIDLSLILFIVAALISFAIAAITVAFHSVRAALTNPVDTLKTE